MRCHCDHEDFYIVGEIRKNGHRVYMAWDGCGAYGETYAGDKAEIFENRRHAKAHLKHDEDARDWLRNHPGAQVLKIRIGYKVYAPTKKRRRHGKNWEDRNGES